MSAVRKSMPLPRHPAADLGFARYRHLPGGNSTIVTNDAGRFHLLPRADFDRLLAGTLPPDSPHLARLAELGFLRSAPRIDVLADRLRDRRQYLFQGPSLHIMILTLRCDQICAYCHASRTNLDQDGYDMSEDTARRVVDRILETTSPYVTIEFQGGEPTVNWPVLQFVVRYATARNRALGAGAKELMFSLVTNMSMMTEERADWLVEQGVMVCTSFDGPRVVHEDNRRLGRASSYDEVTRWLGRFDEKYRAAGKDPELAYVNALLTVTRATLSQDPRDVVNEYVRLGLRAIHLRPLNPFGFATRTWQRIGYSAAEYLHFYRRCLDHIIELNRSGASRIIEKKTALYLEKIFTDRDPNYMELRSPCGAGVGQLGYNHDGKVYTCDEGRMIGRMGDDLFEIGDVGVDGVSQQDFLSHPAVRTMQAASYLDTAPGCSDCSYNPYCGVCPIYNYVEQGDLFGKMPGSDWCGISMGVCDYLFERLAREGDAFRELVRSWAEVKDRSAAYCVKPGSSMTW